MKFEIDYFKSNFYSESLKIRSYIIKYFKTHVLLLYKNVKEYYEAENVFSDEWIKAIKRVPQLTKLKLQSKLIYKKFHILY